MGLYEAISLCLGSCIVHVQLSSHKFCLTGTFTNLGSLPFRFSRSSLILLVVFFFFSHFLFVSLHCVVIWSFTVHANDWPFDLAHSAAFMAAYDWWVLDIPVSKCLTPPNVCLISLNVFSLHSLLQTVKGSESAWVWFCQYYSKPSPL